MSRYLEYSWFRTTLLLSALAAGGLATLFVPGYQEMAATTEKPTPPASVRQVRGNASSDVTGIDVDLRHLKLVRSTT